MSAEADAFIGIPGGFGTLEEVLLACAHGHGEREPVVFLICDACGAVEEATSPGVNRGLAGLAAGAGFEPRSQVVEVVGRCAACQAALKP